MPRSRSRSRSPRRDRRRSTSRERERKRTKERHRSRSRSRSPRRHRGRSRSRSWSPRRKRSPSPRKRSRTPSPGPSESPEIPKSPHDREPLDAETMATMTDDDKEMMKVMGFFRFDTTKGKATDEDTNLGEAKVLEKRKYRQYMNRRGGFNRPLDFIA